MINKKSIKHRNKLNYNWLKNIVFIFLVAIGMSGCDKSDNDSTSRGRISSEDNATSEENEKNPENDKNTFNAKDLVGVYLSDNACIIVLHEDETADFYKLGDNSIYTNNEWSYNNERLNIDFKDLHSKVSCDVYDPNDLFMQSDSALWENSTYTKINEDYANLSISNCNEIIAKYLDVDITEYMESNNPNFSVHEFDGIAYKIPSYLSYVGDNGTVTAFTNDKGTMYYGFVSMSTNGISVGSEMIKNNFMNNNNKVGNEGEIKIAGLPGCFS